MFHFSLIFICLILGVGLRRFTPVPASAPLFLNRCVIYLSLPALVLVQIPPLWQTTAADRSLLVPLSMSWMLLLLAFFVFTFVGRRKGWTTEMTGALVLTSGLANTSFVGIPLLQAVVGEEAVAIGLLIDQAGSFLTLSTLGFGLAAYFSGNRLHVGVMARRILFFPPFLALMTAVVLGMAGWQAGGLVLKSLKAVAATLVPCALVSVGLQLRVSRAVLVRYKAPLCMGLGFKLGVAPLFFVLLYAGLFSSHGFVPYVTVLQSAMAPMITAAIVANQFQLDRELPSLMLGIGIPLSMLTVPAWSVLLQRVIL